MFTVLSDRVSEKIVSLNVPDYPCRSLFQTRIYSRETGRTEDVTLDRVRNYFYL
jgi:hypothetical protein